MIGNPFRYGDVATGNYFTNRVHELAEVQDDIRNGQNIVIISPRRYGKTSLMVEAITRLRREHALVAYLDLFRAPTKDRFADLLATAIYDGLVNPVERAWQNAVDLFQKLPPAEGNHRRRRQPLVRILGWSKVARSRPND